MFNNGRCKQEHVENDAKRNALLAAIRSGRATLPSDDIVSSLCLTQSSFKVWLIDTALHQANMAMHGALPQDLRNKIHMVDPASVRPRFFTTESSTNLKNWGEAMAKPPTNPEDPRGLQHEIRTHEWIFWPINFGSPDSGGHWITCIIRLKNKDEEAGRAAGSLSEFYYKEVAELAILDPFKRGRTNPLDTIYIRWHFPFSCVTCPFPPTLSAPSGFRTKKTTTCVPRSYTVVKEMLHRLLFMDEFNLTTQQAGF